MNCLLDTHVVLWWLDGGEGLSEKAFDAISDGKNVVFISAASIWEIRVKEAIGKLMIPNNFQKVLSSQPFEMLPVTAEHAHEISKLPLIHRDLFDRMLVAQARFEKLTLVSRDTLLKKYKIPLIIA